MTVVLTAMNRFINEADGSQTAFLDGNQPERQKGTKPQIQPIPYLAGIHPRVPPTSNPHSLLVSTFDGYFPLSSGDHAALFIFYHTNKWALLAHRLCAPMVDHVERLGGRVLTGKPISAIETDNTGEVRPFLPSSPCVPAIVAPAACQVSGLRMADGSMETADFYVSAMPVDVLKRLIPARWSTMPFFSQANSTYT